MTPSAESEKTVPPPAAPPVRGGFSVSRPFAALCRLLRTTGKALHGATDVTLAGERLLVLFLTLLLLWLIGTGQNGTDGSRADSFGLDGTRNTYGP